MGALLLHTDGRMDKQTERNVKTNSRFSSILRKRLKTVTRIIAVIAVIILILRISLN
jgi:hypothetical protein